MRGSDGGVAGSVSTQIRPAGELGKLPKALVQLVPSGLHCSTLVLTHFMPEIDAERESAVATVREHFHGIVLVAHDLMTIPVDHQTG